MQQRALFDHRLWVALGLALAAAFWMLPEATIGEAARIVLKGASVAALAVYAARSSSHPDARTICAVLLAGAAGDVALELSTVAGGALFLLSHLVAIALYWRSRRPDPATSQRAAALALVIATPLAAWLLTRDPLPVVYAVALGGMAATAWLSRFSRYVVGLGALLFVASDLLIFARLGGRIDEGITDRLVWPLYFTAQVLICTGVVRATPGGSRVQPLSKPWS